MPIDWRRVYNRLFRIINSEGSCYFSGPRFIEHVRSVDPDFPDYWQFMEDMKKQGGNTSRKYFFHDILMSFSENRRLQIINSILRELEDENAEGISDIRGLLGGGISAPSAEIGINTWNADRLNHYLEEIDNSIASTNYERAVSLSYTCLSLIHI